MNKVLVCYFSATGTTKRAANRVVDAVNGDIFEIEPVDIYTEDDLNWHVKESRSTIEMQDKSFRPPIKSKTIEMNNYDTIILGFPVWWYTAPTIINTFIEKNNFDNKNVYIFVTSGSSSSEDSFNDLQSTYPNIHFISSKRLTGVESNEEILNWLNYDS